MGAPSPTSAAGGDDFVNVEDQSEISGGRDEAFPASRHGEGGSEDSGLLYHREWKVLPEELSRSVVKLTCESAAEGGVCEVYLVGTAHVSRVIFLELCSSRIAVLMPQNLKVPTMVEMVEMWKKNHNLFVILYSWFLAKVASKLEVFPGSEFRVAYEEAKKYGAKVILDDRPVQRTWAKMPLWHKTKLL